MAQEPGQHGRAAASGRQIEAAQEVTAASPFSAPTGQAPTGPETDLWTGRTSWKHYLGRIVLWLFIVVAAAVGAWALPSRLDLVTPQVGRWAFAAIFALSTLLMLGGVAVKVLGTKYRLTSQRLFICRGILSQTTDQTELIRVDDVSVFKTFFGRMLSVGTISMLTTDATDRQLKMEGIGEPEKVAEAIRSRMRTLRGKSLYVENL